MEHSWSFSDAAGGQFLVLVGRVFTDEHWAGANKDDPQRLTEAIDSLVKGPSPS